MSAQPKVELREFLRSRRARVTPAAAGLPSRLGARRVPGLRGSTYLPVDRPRGQSEPTPVPSELGRGIREDLDHLVIEQLGNV
jgi:hypothetical protein